MNETYVECLVARETKIIIKFLKYLLMTLAIAIGVLSIMFIGSVLGLLVAVAFGVGAYFVGQYSDIEYEYLYVDKTISVDKIYAKSRRKKIATYEVDKMEIIAPVKSYKLDDFKNRNVKTVDYTSGVSKQPDPTYVFYYEGQQKVLFEPNEAMIKALSFVAPRKVFTN